MSVELVYDVGWVAPPVDTCVDHAVSGEDIEGVEWAALDSLLVLDVPPDLRAPRVRAANPRPTTDGPAAGLSPGGGVDPIDQVVADLGVVDRAMARVLRGMAVAGPRDGLSVRRLVGLLAGATGVDVGFVDRAVEVLRPMPLVRAAFDEGVLSWSQVRGIVIEARRLSVAQREVLDGALAGTVASGRGRGEPDRVVEVAGDLAAGLDERGQEQLEGAQERAQRLVLQPDFDGWGDIHGTLGPEVFASTAAALDALADAPVAGDAPPVSDDDGRVLPVVARPPTSRSAQLAEALGRMAALVLGGSHRGCDGESDADASDDEADAAGDPEGAGDSDAAGAAGPAGDAEGAGAAGGVGRTSRGGCGGGLRRARPRVMVIARLADLLAAEQHLKDNGVAAPTAADVGGGPVDVRMAQLTSRLLLRRGNGRRRITRALTQALADDADLVPVFVDDGGMPVAIGDSFSPISPARRRAVMMRDQGCRAPGCTAPPEHCDVHHVIPRETGGLTVVGNLALMCRACHTRITRHRWQMTLHADGVLTTRIGRHTFTTRPRLTDPGPDPTSPGPGRSDGGPHVGGDPDGTQARARSDVHAHRPSDPRPIREPERRPGRPDQPVTP